MASYRMGVRPVALTIAAGGLLLGLSGCDSLPKIRMPQVFSPPACADFAISIYFEPGSAVVTKEAQALIHSAGARARRCQVSGVDVVGLASAAGDSAMNLDLSRNRAATVTAALAANGFEHVDINTTAVGDEGSQTRQGEVRPMRRRVNVDFHLVAKPNS